MISIFHVILFFEVWSWPTLKLEELKWQGWDNYWGLMTKKDNLSRHRFKTLLGLGFVSTLKIGQSYVELNSPSILGLALISRLKFSNEKTRISTENKPSIFFKFSSLTIWKYWEFLNFLVFLYRNWTFLLTLF